MSDKKPRRVTAKITRVVTEWAVVNLDTDGNVDEYIEQIEETECGEILELHRVGLISSYHD